MDFTHSWVEVGNKVVCSFVIFGVVIGVVVVSVVGVVVVVVVSVVAFVVVRIVVVGDMTVDIVEVSAGSIVVSSGDDRSGIDDVGKELLFSAAVVSAW